MQELYISAKLSAERETGEYMIKENLTDIEKRITDACIRSGRERNEILLIAVSKTKPFEMILEALDAGLYDFGENKPQELKKKYELMNETDYVNVNWHMIGNLQRNKVKYVVGRTRMIHSVDSLLLAEEINKESKNKNLITSVLIEVNIAHETSKSGVAITELEALVYDISRLSNIHICGLMTVAPFVDDPEENRLHFRKMKQLCVDIGSKNIDNISMNELSMGMTNDYEVAIEEGATMIRIGTGLFGTRNYEIN